MELSTVQKGELALLKTLVRSVEKGWIASRPTRDCRYDLILDENGKLYRVQVKYTSVKASHVSGAVSLNLTKGGLRNRRYLQHEIDAIVVYIAPADLLVWLRPDKFHDKSFVTIRYTPTLNNQKAGVLLAQNIAW